MSIVKVTLMHLSLISVILGAGITDTVVVKKSNAFISPKDKSIKPTANKMASARMSHVKHAAANVKCDQCHHTMANPDNLFTCAKCHKGESGSRVLMTNSCVKCHKKIKKGPLKCKECHTVALVKN